jgi:hypothetical protein
MAIDPASRRTRTMKLVGGRKPSSSSSKKSGSKKAAEAKKARQAEAEAAKRRSAGAERQKAQEAEGEAARRAKGKQQELEADVEVGKKDTDFLKRTKEQGTLKNVEARRQREATVRKSQQEAQAALVRRQEAETSVAAARDAKARGDGGPESPIKTADQRSRAISERLKSAADRAKKALEAKGNKQLADLKRRAELQTVAKKETAKQNIERLRSAVKDGQVQGIRLKGVDNVGKAKGAMARRKQEIEAAQAEAAARKAAADAAFAKTQGFKRRLDDATTASKGGSRRCEYSKR